MQPIIPMAAVIAVLAISPPADAEPLGLKKAVLGMSLDDFKAAFQRPALDHEHPALTCSDAVPPTLHVPEKYAQYGMVACREHLRPSSSRTELQPTIAGVLAQITYVFLPDRTGTARLFQIDASFARSAFDTMIGALAAKYGHPTDAEPGGHSQQWSLAGGAISSRRFDTDSSEARVMFWNPETMTRLREMRAEAARSRAADL